MSKKGHPETCNPYCAIRHCAKEGCDKENQHGYKYCNEHNKKETEHGTRLRR